MTPEGHAKITEALSEAGLNATVTPHPQEGDDFRYVGIRLSERYLSSLRTLNVLDQAGLMYREGASNTGLSSDPQLHPLSVETGDAIFEDKNAGSGF